MFDECLSPSSQQTVGAPDARPRFLSEADCHDIAQRLARVTLGGGFTALTIASTWRGNIRWARNRITTSGEDRNDHVVVFRNLRGATDTQVTINNISDGALLGAARRAERLARFRREVPESDYLILHEPPEPYAAPALFFEATYQQDAARRAELARSLAQPAAAAGMLSAGYIEVSAHSRAFITSTGYTRYFPYTWAQYSVTVRDPAGIGSGWAGVDWSDWNKIDAEHLSSIALDKCLKSRNPVAIEPGRYTTILEPQAVCDLVSALFNDGDIDRWNGTNGGNEHQKGYPFNKDDNHARLGERMIDERITLSADPLDPALGFPPFALQTWDGFDVPAEVYHPATWIKEGVIVNLPYPRKYGVGELGLTTGLPNSGAFRMSVTGPTTSVADMIATTKRGVMVTRFDSVMLLDQAAVLCHGYTRDGLWLIENGQISKPVKNMLFVESVLFALNNVEQLGVPQRAFHPDPGYFWWSDPQPVFVPPMRVRDFSFTALADAI